MKRFILLFILSGIAVVAFSQYNTYYGSKAINKRLISPLVRPSGGEVPGQQTINGSVSSQKSVLADSTIMTSYYDLQTNNSSGQQRIYQFPDGSIGGVATMSHTSTGSAWPDRGTGYNYSANNGGTWGTPPTTRVETSIRTGWPSYQPWNTNGECIIAHQFPTGNLILSTRPTKGTGTWTTTNTLAPPATVPAMAWPRMVTSGSNHMTIHVIAVTEPTANNGVIYNGMDGALCYARSTDGGATWGTGWQQLPGTTSSDYIQFVADQYAWAMPHGDTLAFVYGDTFADEFMMKSTDNGATWTKTVIYNSPYNLIGYPGTLGDPGFYNPDGTSAVALDYYGNAHVLFGLQWDSTTSTGASYLPNMSGLVYWNETMTQLPQSLNPDVLYAQGNLIAWQVDTTIYWDGTSTQLPFASYYSSLTSNPGIMIDHHDNMFVIYSTVVHHTDASTPPLFIRHVFEKKGCLYPDGSFFFHSTFIDLTDDFVFNFLECMYADICQSSYDNRLHILFQADTYAGSYVKDLNNPSATGQTSPTNNSFIVINPDTWFFLPCNPDDVHNIEGNTTFDVSSNYPNPFHETTSIIVNNQKPGNMSIEVMNMLGQRMSLVNYGYAKSGSNQYSIDGSRLSPGIYFYRVKFNNETVTMKMVVD